MVLFIGFCEVMRKDGSNYSLRSRLWEVFAGAHHDVYTKERERSLARPVLSCAHYFQAPSRQVHQNSPTVPCDTAPTQPYAYLKMPHVKSNVCLLPNF